MKIAIVDDQIEYREQIKELLKASGKELEIECFENGEKLLVNSYKNFNIVFLDIVMNGESGVDIACKIKEEKPNVVIFFITSHAVFISDAMRNKPFQYLIKPIDEMYFKIEFERAIKEVEMCSMEFQYKWSGIEKIIPINEIVYIESCLRKLIIHNVKNEKIFAQGKIEYCEKDLVILNFVRIHKSFLVNMKHIDYVEQYLCHLKNGEIIPISKSHSGDVAKAFRRYISGVSL